jgi:hypothetical protein
MDEKTIEIALENDRVRVIRIKANSAAQFPRAARNDRVVIYLSDAHVRRTESGCTEEIHHRVGDVVWRSASQHQVESLKNEGHEVIIVELKK